MHLRLPTSYLDVLIDTTGAVCFVGVACSTSSAWSVLVTLLLVGNSPFLRLIPCPSSDFCVLRAVAATPIDLAVVFISACSF